MNTRISPRTATWLFVSMLILLPAFPTPATAQSASASASTSASPGSDQYATEGGDVTAANDAVDAGDIPPAFSNNVTNGAEAVNEAMAARDAPSAKASISTTSAPAGSDPTSSSTTNSAAENLTVLPDTGGVPLPALGAGLLRVAGAGGLCAHRMLRQ